MHSVWHFRNTLPTMGYGQIFHIIIWQGPSWPWSYGCWIYNYLWNQCLSPLMLWVQISTRRRCTTLCDKVCQWLATGRWFSLGSPVSSTNTTNRQYITEILLKVAFNTMKQTNKKQIFHIITWQVNIDDFLFLFWHIVQFTLITLLAWMSFIRRKKMYFRLNIIHLVFIHVIERML
jgi:hypothetical protein